MHDGLLGGSLEADVDEAGAGDVDGLDPAHIGWVGHQGVAQLLAQLARVALQGFGQLHGRRAGKVAMGGHFGRLKSRFSARTGEDVVELGGQGREQFLFG